MKLAILVPVLRGCSGGILKHLNGIVPLLRQQPTIEKMAIIVPKKFSQLFQHLDLEVKVVSNFDYFLGFREMGMVMSHGNYDVALSVTARNINKANCPVVMMAQNIEPFFEPIYPIPILYRFRLKIIKHEYGKACLQATKIIALSKCMKEVLVNTFGIPNQKVSVIYNGYDSSNHKNPQRPNFAFPKEFFFSSGSFAWYRGFEDIIMAISNIKRRFGSAPTVALSGRLGFFVSAYRIKLENLAQEQNVVENILWLGELSQEEQTWCYQNSIAFIQTSRAESFSNTQLEAMGQCKLCICSDNPVMREIFQNNALYYQTGDSHSLANKIHYLLNISPKVKSLLSKSMHSRANDFSWNITTDKTLEILKLAIKNKH